MSNGVGPAGADPGARIEELLAQLADSPDEPRIRALVRAIMEMYGGALGRVVALAADHPALAALADDPVISPLLAAHGIHPMPVADRVRRAIEGVRPHLGDRGVELIAIEDGTARVRLLGSDPHGSVSGAVRAAIDEAAPDLDAVSIETTGGLLSIGRRGQGER